MLTAARIFFLFEEGHLGQCMYGILIYGFQGRSGIHGFTWHYVLRIGCA